MALVPETLQSDIKAALEIGLKADPKSDPELIVAETAQKLADAIDAYIRSGDIMGVTTLVTGVVPAPPALPNGVQVAPVKMV